MAHEAAVALGRVIQGVHAGDDKLAWRKLCGDMPGTIEVRSPSFEPGGLLPKDSTGDGAGAPPRIEWRNVPSEARSLALLCEDPDAPFSEPFVHWLVYDLSPAVAALGGESESTGTEGRNGKQQAGFTGAAPPPGHGVHHYHFQLFALDYTLKLSPNEERGALLGAMRGHVVAFGELIGTYERT